MRSTFINELPISALLRETVRARTVLMGDGMATDRVILLKTGQARGRDGCVYNARHVLNFKEFLALSAYQTPVTCLQECELIHIPRQLIRDTLAGQNTHTWTLARGLALDHLMTQAAS